MNPAPLRIPATIEIDYDVDTATVPTGGRIHVSLGMRTGRVMLDNGVAVLEFDIDGVREVMAAREGPCNAQMARSD